MYKTLYQNGGNDQDYQNELNRLNEEIARATTEYNTRLKQAKQNYITDSLQGTLRDENGALIGGNGSDAVITSSRDDYNNVITQNRQYTSISGLTELTAASDYATIDGNDISITNSNQGLKTQSYAFESQKAAIESRQRQINDSKKSILTSQEYKQAKLVQEQARKEGKK